MRIRSIKPEFWRSEAIAALPHRARLTFIGLWSYVDDNGVGLDSVKVVAADLFALEDDPRETLANVREDLATLSAAGRIRRYTVEGKSYLSIVGWSEHQKIDKPGKPRYPGPDDPRAVHCEPVTSTNVNPSRHPREGVAKDSRSLATSPRLEQGNRGTEEQGNRGVPPTAGASSALALTTVDTSQTIIGEWLEHCRKRPPGNVIGQVGKTVKMMLSEGIDPADVRRGLAAWHSKGLHPSTLPSIVNQVMNASSGIGMADRPSTTDMRVNAALRLAAQFDAMDAAAVVA